MSIQGGPRPPSIADDILHERVMQALPLFRQLIQHAPQFANYIRSLLPPTDPMQPWSPSAVEDFLLVLKSHGLTLGEFLVLLFSRGDQLEDSRSHSHATYVSMFLKGHSTVKPDELVQMIYTHRDSAPMATRGNSKAAQNPKDGSGWARALLLKWAVKLVIATIRQETDQLNDVKTSILRSSKAFSWNETFELTSKAPHRNQRHTPILLRILLPASTPESVIKAAGPAGVRASLIGQLENEAHSANDKGPGRKKRSPLVVFGAERCNDHRGSRDREAIVRCRRVSVLRS